MVSIRSAIQFVAVALYAASNAQALYIPTSEYSKRDIASSDEVFALSTRDLSDVISYVLVARTSPPPSRTPTPDGFPKTKADADNQIAYWRKEMGKSETSVKKWQDALDAAKKAKPQNKETIRKAKNELDSARGAKEAADEQITSLENMKKTLPN